MREQNIDKQRGDFILRIIFEIVNFGYFIYEKEKRKGEILLYF